MDFNMKQWRDESEREQVDQNPPPASSSAIHLFFTEPDSNLSAYSSGHHPKHSLCYQIPQIGSYFSTSQWQELELQALIFRHMISGADVPSELLHLVKKSLINSSPSYYLSNPLHPFYPHNYQTPSSQSGYWGRGAMDPEPWRCRRTDGKKWRCSRDVVAGQKYCERHVHRGRSRSRKPVETPTSAAAPYAVEEAVKTNYSVTRQGVVAGGGGSNYFTLTTTTTHSADLLHLHQRSLVTRLSRQRVLSNHKMTDNRVVEPYDISSTIGLNRFPKQAMPPITRPQLCQFRCRRTHRPISP
ncbi:hypothetical protein OROGR_018664 [Orobanche gracilis]